MAATVRRAATRITLFVAVLLGLAGLQPALGQAADATVTQSDLCAAWGTASSNPEIVLESGLKITGSSLQRSGSSCTADGASISVSNSAITEVAPTSGGNAASRILAAVTREVAASTNDLKVGDEVFKGAVIRSLTTQIQVGFIGIRGGIEIQWTGGTVTKLQFSGKLYGVNRYSMTLSSPVDGTKLPNVGGDAIKFNGDLVRDSSGTRLNLTGSAPSIVLGEGDKQLTVTNGNLSLKLADEQAGTGLKFTAAGGVTVGSAVKLTGATVNALFDDTGLLSFQGGGALDVTIPASGSSPAGSVTGNAQLAYERGGAQSVTFTGDARFGEALVAGATGTLDAQAVSFTGNVELSNADLTVKGGVDGIAFYGDNLTGRTIQNRAGDQVQAQKGDALVKSANANITAKGLTVSGNAQIGNVGGEQWAKASGDVDLSFDVDGQPTTTLKGSASLDWVKGSAPAVAFKGDVTSGSTTASAEGTVDGDKLAFKGNAKLSNPDLTVEGAVDGVVYYGNGSGDTLADKSGAQVAAKKGDFVLKSASATIKTKGFELSGAASMARVGGDRWASGSGDVDLTLGATTLKGKASMTWSAGEIPSVTFSGSIKQGDTGVANVEGSVDGSKLTFKGDGTLNVNGLAVKGAVDGTLFYGNDLAGQTITDGSGKQVQAAKGDYILKSLSGDVTVKALSLGGEVSLGSVGGVQWAKAGGSVDVTSGGTRIKGSADLAWSEGDSPVVNFTGSLTSGTTTVADASGTIDGKKISLNGSASFTSPDLSLSGAVEGVAYYGDPAGDTLPNADGTPVAAEKGDYLLKSATGSVTVKGLKLDGDLSLGKVAGGQYAKGGGSVDATSGLTTLKGSAGFTWASGGAASVTFSGTVTSGTTTVANASGTIDGKKIELKGGVSFTDPALTLSGEVEGVLYYGDPAGDTLPNAAGTQVAAQKGDYVLKSASGAVTVKNVALTGNVSFGKVAGSQYAKGGGSVDLTSGATKLTGSASFTWGGTGAATLTFSGSVTSGNAVLANASGTLDGRKLIGRGDVTVKETAYTASGSVSGVVYYGDPAGDKLQGPTGALLTAKKGDWLLKAASGQLTAKGTTLSGNLSAGVVAGVKWAKLDGSIDTTFGNPATTIKGSATFTWAASGSGTLTFNGTVVSGATTITGKGSLDGKKIALTGSVAYSTSDLTINGAVDGTVYYGDPAGDTLPNAAGTQVAAQKGDYVVKSASGSVTVKNLALSGNVSLGKVAGSQWATGGGSVDVTSGATNLKGSATFDWATGKAPSVTFTGSVTSGTTTVASASGTLDGKKIALKGSATITESAYSLSGSIDGVVYYGDPAGDTITDKNGAQVPAAKGDYYLKSAAGSLTAKGTTLSGNVSAGKSGGQQWATGGGSVNITGGSPVTTIKGSATFAWSSGGTGTLTFDGTVTQADNTISAKGTMDGKKLLFSGSVSSPTLSGNATGGVYYGSDLSGETIVNRSGQTVATSKGDYYLTVTDGKVVLKQLTATANFTLKKVGAVTWVKTDAQIKVGATWLTFSGELDSTGNVNLKGAGSVALDGYNVNFNGAAVIQNNALTLTGTVDIVTDLFGVRLSGTITKADMNSSAVSFVGSAAFRFGGYDVTSATVRFVTGEGITTAFDIKYCVLFVCTTGTYKLYFTGSAISRIQLNSPIASWPAFFAIAKITAPNIPVETKITGLI